MIRTCIVGLLLVVTLGCGESRLPLKFKAGQLVRIKVDGQKGMITTASALLYDFKPYEVRLAGNRLESFAEFELEAWSDTLENRFVTIEIIESD